MTSDKTEHFIPRTHNISVSITEPVDRITLSRLPNNYAWTKNTCIRQQQYCVLLFLQSPVSLLIHTATDSQWILQVHQSTSCFHVVNNFNFIGGQISLGIWRILCFPTLEERNKNSNSSGKKKEQHQMKIMVHKAEIETALVGISH